MLRILRIAGIIVFAWLVGFSAHSLYRQFDAGTLYDQYNSQRKSSITLLTASLLALISLGSAEIILLRKSSGHRRYGGRHYHDDERQEIEERDLANIYSSPKTKDLWNSHTIRKGRDHRRPVKQASERWMGIVRVYCSLLPLLYLGTCAFICIRGEHGVMEHWILPALFSGLFLFSFFVAIGIFCKKAWGLTLGYLLAILNLVVFPYGTVVGLLLIIGLVGVAPAFAEHEIMQRRKSRSIAL